ncbi:hypothetical protein ACV4JJ_004221 [Escherichia coli]
MSPEQISAFQAACLVKPNAVNITATNTRHGVRRQMVIFQVFQMRQG